MAQIRAKAINRLFVEEIKVANEYMKTYPCSDQ